MLKRIGEAVDFLLKHNSIKPEIGIILGSGLSGFAVEINKPVSFDYTEIPSFPKSTVEGHDGKLIFGELGGKMVVAMQGRLHFYEGHPMEVVTFPVRVLKMLGIKILVLSNACGGLNPVYSIGDLMFIEDHINLMPNPLIGANLDDFGPRFPDMSDAYDKELLKLACNIAIENNISFHKGIYAGVSGPSYETPAEYRYIRNLGADAVGMSTVPEVIVARHMKLRCFALSVISDLGVDGKIVEISHKDVLDAASLSEPLVTKLVKRLVTAIDLQTA